MIEKIQTGDYTKQKISFVYSCIFINNYPFLVSEVEEFINYIDEHWCITEDNKLFNIRNISKCEQYVSYAFNYIGYKYLVTILIDRGILKRVSDRHSSLTPVSTKVWNTFCEKVKNDSN